MRNGFDIELPDIITMIIAEFMDESLYDNQIWMIAHKLRLSRGHQKGKRHQLEPALMMCD